MIAADNSSVDESLNSAVRILLDLQQEDPEKKQEAIKNAGHFVEQRNYFPEAVPVLIRLLEQEQHPKLAEEAAWALWKFNDRRAIPALFKKAKESPNLTLRKKTIRALGLLEAPEALPFLCRLIHDKSFIIRGTAVAALGSFKEPKLVNMLERSLEDESSFVRHEALASLGRFLRREPKFLTTTLLKKIEGFLSVRREKNPTVRLEALVTLSYVGIEAARNQLIKTAKDDPASFVRQGGLSLLQRFGDSFYESALINGLEDRDWSVRFEAAQLLIQAVEQKKICNRISVLLALHKIAHIFPEQIPAKQNAAKLLNRFNALGY